MYVCDFSNVKQIHTRFVLPNNRSGAPGDVSDGGYLLDDTPTGGSPRPMEPMGPHRPRALKYTPMGPHRPRALKYTPTGGSPRPIGQGPSAKAHGAHGAPYGHVFLDLVFLAQSRPSWGVNPSTPWPPGGFRPNLCSTKIASRASQGRSGYPVPVYTNLQFYKNFNFF